VGAAGAQQCQAVGALPQPLQGKCTHTHLCVRVSSHSYDKGVLDRGGREHAPALAQELRVPKVVGRLHAVHKAVICAEDVWLGKRG